MRQPPSPTGGAGSLTDLWTAETIRLREALWGPLEDSAEVRQARAEGHGFVQRLLLRARLLARRESLDKVLRQWQRVARLALLAMLAAAALAGIGTALSALGDGARSINLNIALATTLGIHSFTLLLWLFSLAIGRGQGGAWLGEAWLWLTRKLARGPDAALAPTALVSLLGRNSSLRWGLGSISHLLWLVLLISMLLALTALLATRSHTFHWETTILPDEAFVSLTGILGWLPSQLGFQMPTESMIRASRNAGSTPVYVHALWTSWLIGCIVTYGLLPRLLAFIVSILLARLNLSSLTLDDALPSYADLRYRLMPSSERTGIDSPLAPEFLPSTASSPNALSMAVASAIVGIELAPDTPWPPAPLASCTDLGIIDTRAQRHHVLDHLQKHRAEKLLIVCDARQTPDRGTIALIADLAGLAQQPAVALIGPRTDALPAGNASSASQAAPRQRQWRQKLTAAGFTDAQIHDAPQAAADWLNADARESV